MWRGLPMPSKNVLMAAMKFVSGCWLLALHFVLLPSLYAQETTLSRDEILSALAVPDAPFSLETSAKAVAPAEKDSALLALQKFASAKADPELIQLLLRYQLAYLSPDNALPAKVMGVVFLEQPDSFVTVYNHLPAAGRVVLGPYLQFGFNRAIEGRNLSSPQIKAAKKKFDALQASLMNARQG